MARIASRITTISSSATLEINQAVAELKSGGGHVFDLGIGEADYPAPTPAAEALAAVAIAGRSRYTSVAGTPALRRAVARYLNRGFYDQTSGVGYLPSYGPDDIVISAGSKHLQYSAILALCEPGDEVILPAPYWVSYPDMVRLAGATPVIVPASADEGFVPPLERLEAAITSRTRLIFLNSPCNPTGRMWTPAQVASLCDLVLAQDDLFLLSDEIYGDIAFSSTRHVSPVTHSPAMRERVILTSGLSKAFSMGGWRVGYAAVADADVRAALLKIGANTISSAPSLTQDAAVAALEARARVDAMRIDYENRAAVLCRRLNAMGLKTLSPQGAFYAFADVSPLFGAVVAGRTLDTTNDVAWAMLKDAHVAAVAGQAFGDERHVRFSFVRPVEELEAACDALEAFVLRSRTTRMGTPETTPTQPV